MICRRTFLFSYRRTLALGGIATSIMLHLISGAGVAQVVVTPVAISGTAAPAGGNYLAFGAGTTVLNASGQVAFADGLSSGSSPSGIFAGSPGALQVVALQNSAAPAGGNYNGLVVGALNTAGQVAFNSSLTGGTSLSGMFAGSPGSAQVIALLGAAAPAGGNYNSMPIPSAFNDSEQVVFMVGLTGGSSTSGLFAGAPGSLQAVALQGNPAPGGGNYSSFSATPVINNSGQVAFSANLTGGPATSGIFAGNLGSLQPVALQGNPAPAGGNYSSFFLPKINASGQVAVSASLTGGSAASGIFAGNVGSLQPVALQGNPAPSGGNYSSLSSTGVMINTSDQVAFATALSGGSSTFGIFAARPDRSRRSPCKVCQHRMETAPPTVAWSFSGSMT